MQSLETNLKLVPFNKAVNLLTFKLKPNSDSILNKIL